MGIRCICLQRRLFDTYIARTGNYCTASGLYKKRLNRLILPCLNKGCLLASLINKVNRAQNFENCLSRSERLIGFSIVRKLADVGISGIEG